MRRPTLGVAWLLKLPGLLLIGGVLLLWIAFKLTAGKSGHDLTAKSTVWGAIQTILIADAAMGLDNVLAVAGAAHGDFALVIIGLLISVPIVIWGSTLFIKLLDRFPWILYAGSGVLAFTAAKMIVDEPLFEPYWTGFGWAKATLVAFTVLIVLAFGMLRNRFRSQAKDNPRRATQRQL